MRLRDRRIRAGFASAADLARALGIHPSIVQLWESGARRIPTKQRSALNQALSASGWWKRCTDRTCGRCIRCGRARAWAEGKYANKRVSEPPDSWSPDQDDRLRQLAGTMDRHHIAAAMSREFPLYPRTMQAITVRAQRIGLSLWPNGRSLWEVGRLLGVTDSRVRTWIDMGMLTTFPFERGAGPYASRRRVHDDDLANFIRQYPEHFTASRVVGTSPLAQLARSYAERRTPVPRSKPRTRRSSAA